MLVICVISAVIGFFVYTVIKIKIQEWNEELRMSRLSLKKRKMEREGFRYDSKSPSSPNGTVEVSSDESDSPSFKQVIKSGKELKLSSPSIESSDDEAVVDFTKSTDSIQTDEEIEETSPNSKSRSMMFDWNQKNVTPVKKNIIDLSDSDSSDNYTEGSMWFMNRPKKKGVKSKIEDPPEKKQDTMPEVQIHFEQMISGIKVKFPVKPYSCQIAVMSKLIQGCVKQENCLLESPTGSGKTLALLCAVLAWHDQHVAEIEKLKNSPAVPEKTDNAATASCQNNGGESFPEDSKQKCTDHFDESAEENDFEDMFSGDKAKKLKIPKIYYGTRTHKQIEQVIRELRKTSYKHKKMTILSSREHTCIQESTKNKTELCNDLLDPAKRKGCPFYNETNKKALGSFHAVQARGLGTVWDIEDLVAIGKNEDLCPYFAARNLAEIADIIFCPYNYIIDPDIRESMQLDLRDQVIILDEAHNIEDICRDVASVTFREDYLVAAASECESLTKQRAADFTTYDTLRAYILKLVTFIKEIILDKVDYNSDNLSSPYWTGAELLELFNMHGLSESAYTSFMVACNSAMADVNKLKDDNRMGMNQKHVKPIISPSTKRIIEHLMFTMRMITSKEFMNDYRACITESTIKDFSVAAENTWYAAKKIEQRARSLKLLCMNPGVIFSPLAHNARSIILASGTLTPTTSFQSELRTRFAHVLNTQHVIPKDQVYATCVPRGPTGINLRANYQNVNTWAFQDELGKVLLDICESMPHGILCFFSSYHVMHTQMGRWKNNNTWDKIVRVKQVFTEPRYGRDLAAVMKEYREVIEETSAGPVGDVTGALFLAVFRGKVAEGIDFKDNEARCVVTVGIPFGVMKDPVIAMKLEYNDKNVSKGLLKGTDWYFVQAFRALNQALGRCLRHIHDWGAVLLVDERFTREENKENLPKWVKTMWIRSNVYSLREDLPNFVARQKAREEKNALS